MIKNHEFSAFNLSRFTFAHSNCYFILISSNQAPPQSLCQNVWGKKGFRFCFFLMFQFLIWNFFLFIFYVEKQIWTQKFSPICSDTFCKFINPNQQEGHVHDFMHTLHDIKILHCSPFSSKNKIMPSRSIEFIVLN